MIVRWSFCFLWFVLFLNSYGKDVSDDCAYTGTMDSRGVRWKC
jgi:hypothetical protein